MPTHALHTSVPAVRLRRLSSTRRGPDAADRPRRSRLAGVPSSCSWPSSRSSSPSSASAPAPPRAAAAPRSRATPTHLAPPTSTAPPVRRTFDCSGLVQYSYRQAGIRSPAPPTSWLLRSGDLHSAAQPGDVVILGGGSHVGIYVGGGQMVDAPHRVPSSRGARSTRRTPSVACTRSSSSTSRSAEDRRPHPGNGGAQQQILGPTRSDAADRLPPPNGLAPPPERGRSHAGPRRARRKPAARQPVRRASNSETSSRWGAVQHLAQQGVGHRLDRQPRSASRRAAEPSTSSPSDSDQCRRSISPSLHMTSRSPTSSDRPLAGDALGRHAERRGGPVVQLPAPAVRPHHQRRQMPGVAHVQLARYRCPGR